MGESYPDRGDALHRNGPIPPATHEENVREIHPEARQAPGLKPGGMTRCVVLQLPPS
jgi:hypothetical protein